MHIWLYLLAQPGRRPNQWCNPIRNNKCKLFSHSAIRAVHPIELTNKNSIATFCWACIHSAYHISSIEFQYCILIEDMCIDKSIAFGNVQLWTMAIQARLYPATCTEHGSSLPFERYARRCAPLSYGYSRLLFINVVGGQVPVQPEQRWRWVMG